MLVQSHFESSYFFLYVSSKTYSILIPLRLCVFFFKYEPTFLTNQVCLVFKLPSHRLRIRWWSSRCRRTLGSPGSPGVFFHPPVDENRVKPNSKKESSITSKNGAVLSCENPGGGVIPSYGLAAWLIPLKPMGPQTGRPSTNGPFFSNIWDESWLTLKTGWVKLYDTNMISVNIHFSKVILEWNTDISNSHYKHEHIWYIKKIKKSHIFPYSYHLF